MPQNKEYKLKEYKLQETVLELCKKQLDETSYKMSIILRELDTKECELCGEPVRVQHCKRICTHCGFQTGCAE